MIVRPTGDTAEIVMQVDHAVISGQLAEAWAGEIAARDSLIVAARLHDIGWRHWEAEPRLNTDTDQPTNFLNVQIDEHLRLYRLGIEEVAAVDPYAGLLVSMHSAGIYTGRYGTQPALKLTRAPDVQSLVDDFVAEQEARYEAVRDGLDVSQDELWRNYLLLQVFDRLSLRVCLGDPAGPGPMEVVLPDEQTLHIAADGDDQTVTPWPFAVDQLAIDVPTRTIPLTGYANDDALRTTLEQAEVEHRTVTLRPVS